MDLLYAWLVGLFRLVLFALGLLAWCFCLWLFNDCGACGLLVGAASLPWRFPCCDLVVCLWFMLGWCFDCCLDLYFACCAVSLFGWVDCCGLVCCV